MPDVVIDVTEEITTIAVTKAKAILIEAGQQGPAGPAGPVGTPFPDGTATGDIIRWNAITEAWESCAEPFDFQGIILLPMTLPGSPVEGFVGYNAEDNSLYVAVE